MVRMRLMRPMKVLGQRVYWAMKAQIYRFVGTALYERKFSRRGITEIRKGFSNINHPHRKWLMERFDALYPFASVLEVGCGYGPNLQLLAMRFPNIQVWGIDINPNSVQEGNALLGGLNIKRTLMVGKADSLSQFADRSFDIVFTDATLLYIGPDKIRTVIGEMKRLSRRALLFVEFHCSELRRDAVGLGVYTPDGWVRDYRRLLNTFFSDESIALIKIPKAVWPEGRWGMLGYLITVMR